MREPISFELRSKVLHRDNYSCRYCGVKNVPFHLDHVYPVIKGGETSYNNLVTACVNCNARKHSSVGIWPKPIGYFEKKPSKVAPIDFILLVSGMGISGSGFGERAIG